MVERLVKMRKIISKIECGDMIFQFSEENGVMGLVAVPTGWSAKIAGEKNTPQYRLRKSKSVVKKVIRRCLAWAAP